MGLITLAHAPKHLPGGSDPLDLVSFFADLSASDLASILASLNASGGADHLYLMTVVR